MSESTVASTVETVENIQSTIEKAEKIEGIKQGAANIDAIKTIKATEEPVAFPSFFVSTEQKQRIEVDILFDKKNGKILSVSKTGLGVDFTQYAELGHSIEWFDFTQPSYDDMVNYRQRSSSFNTKAGKILVDSILLRSCFLVWHLKDWSLKDSKGLKVELTFDPNGSLNKDSIDLVYKAFPTMIDVVLTLFEKDIILT